MPLRIFYVTKINFLVSGNIKLKMCRKVELFNKRMVLGVIVNNPVPVSLLSGDRKPQIRFLGNHPSGSGNLYHKSFRM